MSDLSLKATASYYESHAATRLLRLAFGAVERWWPALSLRLAVRVFCTPLPLKTWQRRRWPAGWQRDAWPFEGASLGVYARTAGDAARPVALLVHGWGGHALQMLALAEALEADGVQPILLELPAHGHSDGATSTLPQFARAIEYVVGRLVQDGRRVRAVVAHSLGANGAAYAASRGLAAERLVLIAPPASPREYTRLFASVFGLTEATRRALQHAIESREAVLMPQFEPQAVGPRIEQPVLVVHDRSDRINLLRDGQAFVAAIRRAMLLETDGLGHRRVLRDESVLRAVVRHVTEPGAALRGP